MDNRFRPACPVYDDLFVDRKEELRRVVRWIQSSSGNLIVSGERGIGKTSLAGRAVAVAKENLKGTLVTTETVYQFHNQAFDSFLYELGKQLTARIWEQVTGKPFSGLFSRALDFAHPRLEGRDAKALTRIYGMLSASQLSTRVGTQDKVGGKLLLDVELQDQTSKEISRGGLSSFEFLSIVDELKRIAAKHKYSRIVVVADEFNYLQPSAQSDFIRRYFQILNSRSIVFALVGVDIDPWSLPGFSQSVETYLALEPFRSVDPVRELIKAGVGSAGNEEAETFLTSQEVCSRILSDTFGNPRLIQQFGYYICEGLATESGHGGVRAAFDRARREFLAERRIEMERTRRMSDHTLPKADQDRGLTNR